MSRHNEHQEGHRFHLSACSASEKLGGVWRRLKAVHIGTETTVGFWGGRGVCAEISSQLLDLERTWGFRTLYGKDC